MSSASAIARAQQALDAGRRARVVCHARLSPACDDDAAQMRFAVEDALNTADFGDAGRLVLVRRLRLAELPARASAALVARAIENAWRAMALRAVPATHPSATRAQAVFFASRFEARLAWLAAVAAGELPAAWFWAAALPELKTVASMSAGAAIEHVVEAALRESEPAVADALKRWPDAPLVALARAMPVATHQRLMQMLASSKSRQRSTPVAALVSRVRAARALPAPLALVARKLAAWAPMEEAPANLLAALWLQPVLHRLPSVDEVLAVASRAVWMAGHAAAVTVPGGGTAGEPSMSLAALDVMPMHVPGEPVREAQAGATVAGPVKHESGSDAVAKPAAWKIESGLAPQARPAVHAKARVAPQSFWPWLVDASFTRFGGLMLVLNVLAALRFGRWLEGIEASDRRRMVQGLLRHCLDAAGAEDDEPQRAWLGEPARPMDSGVRLWTLRLRRTLRRHARMDLADLVRRPAWVSGTPTHLDVIFAMDDVDLRLRRLGLDADPGWVPWFGRIVNFHFIDASLLPEPEEDAHG